MHHGVLLNFYSGFDGRVWRTLTSPRFGMLSPDPDTWEGDYIAANGSAVEDGQSVLYWYQAGGRRPRIGMARNWKKRATPVLDVGPGGAWDELGVADPYVIKEGDWYYLFFLGQDRARRQRIGLARSRDGINWQKLRANPTSSRSVRTGRSTKTAWANRRCGDPTAVVDALYGS